MPTEYSSNEIILGKEAGIEAGGFYVISVRGKDKGCSSVALSLRKTVKTIDLKFSVGFEYICEVGNGNMIIAEVATEYKEEVSYNLYNEEGIIVENSNPMGM